VRAALRLGLEYRIPRQTGGAPPAPVPTDFGTLQGWIDPRFEISHGGDATPITDWNDHSTNAHNGTVIGGPTYEALGWNGALPSVLFDGTDDALSMDTLATFASGTDQPVYIVMALQGQTLTSVDRILSFGHSTVVETSRMHSLHWTTSNRYLVSRRDDAALQKTDVSNVNAATTNRAHITWEFNGTVSNVYINGVVDSLMSAGDLDVAAITLNRFALGCGRGSTNANFGHFRLGPILIYSNLTNRAGAEQWLTDQGYTHA
jgi:hypothetical protein